MESAFGSLLRRLDAVREQVRAELSVKDRDSADQRTTLELWIGGLPRIVATSAEAELSHALSQVATAATAQLNETYARREPRNNRQRRDTIRGS